MAGASRDTFDVQLRLAQVAAIQSGFYLILSMALTLMCWIGGLNPHLGLIFSSLTLDFSYTQGWTPVAAYVVACLPLTNAVYLCADRPRECLDFASTVYVLHLFAVMSYTCRFPTEMAWWIVILASIISVSVGSEFLCLRREAIKRSNSDRDAIALSEIASR